MSKEALKLALEALDHNLLFTSLMPRYDGRIIEKAYKAINKALAEQPAQQQQERCHLCDCTGDIHSPDGEWRGECPYCKQPAQRKPLTDKEIDSFREANSEGRGAGWRFNFKGFARAIEAAHGIKENT